MCIFPGLNEVKRVGTGRGIFHTMPQVGAPRNILYQTGPDRKQTIYMRRLA